MKINLAADVLGVPFAASTCAEPTSLGAAILAARALGWADLAGLVEDWVHTNPPHTPAPQRHSFYTKWRKERAQHIHASP